MSIARRTAFALISALVLLAGCERGVTHSEPRHDTPIRAQDGVPGGGPTILESFPDSDSTDIIPLDTTGRGGGTHGSGG